ncbi:DUF2804 family protein [Psychrobacter sp.]|uniref:DUF2804 family protein n=1 Tax=Psychrobacter sp. TaxID=56811 RepID=UPI0025D5A441|nr:DUF2804 family protein [Psychrobacter sp.]
MSNKEDSSINSEINKELDNKTHSNSVYKLRSIEQLIEQGQPQFGVFAKVGQVNYLDYHSHLISQKPIASWRKHLKVNQFAFIQMVHSPYRICIAIATIKLATTAFVYMYNERSKNFEIVEALQPFTLNTVFKGDHQNGEMIFEHDNLCVKMYFSPKLVSLKLNSKFFSINADLQRSRQPLAMCSPSGRRGWTFTQKEPFAQTVGELLVHERSKHYAKAMGTRSQFSNSHNSNNLNFNNHNSNINDFKNTQFKTTDLKTNKTNSNNSPSNKLVLSEATRANLDWTLGYMRHITNWFWCCINSQLDDQRQFVLNLSMGVNETGVSENACWLDGNIYYLPPVMFHRNEHRGKAYAVWSITHQNLGWSMIEIDLTFNPIEVYKKTDNYAVIASIFEQWIGYYSGHIKLYTGEIIVLDRIMGLAEDHYAKW